MAVVSKPVPLASKISAFLKSLIALLEHEAPAVGSLVSALDPAAAPAVAAVEGGIAVVGKVAGEVEGVVQAL